MVEQVADTPYGGGGSIVRYPVTIRLLLKSAALAFLLLGIASSTLIIWAVREQHSDVLVINLAGRRPGSIADRGGWS